jgi:hypothetical protein
MCLSGGSVGDAPNKSMGFISKEFNKNDASVTIVTGSQRESQNISKILDGPAAAEARTCLFPFPISQLKIIPRPEQNTNICLTP